MPCTRSERIRLAGLAVRRSCRVEPDGQQGSEVAQWLDTIESAAVHESTPDVSGDRVEVRGHLGELYSSTYAGPVLVRASAAVRASSYAVAEQHEGRRF